MPRRKRDKDKIEVRPQRYSWKVVATKPTYLEADAVRNGVKDKPVKVKMKKDGFVVLVGVKIKKKIEGEAPQATTNEQ